MNTAHRILTIGHSNHPIERFVGLLQQHGVQLLADVRSTPFSRFDPQFNRASLSHSLASGGIRYEFLGEALGARSSDPACFEDGRVSYARLASTSTFRAGIVRLQEAAESQQVAIMCAEREPLDCHRTILVTRELERVGITVAHILADGRLEDNAATLARLVTHLKLDTNDSFSRSVSELNEAAYDAQAAKIAYVPKATAKGGR